jgi:acetyltransferase-like isoleucine patch superfamily enzyme
LIRLRVTARFSRFASIAAPMAVGEEAPLADGAIICDFAWINVNTRIGGPFHLSGYSFITHDCVIADFGTFAGAVQCNGNVHLGDGVQIGLGAVLRNGSPERPLVIGEGAVIGAGAVVVRNVPPTRPCSATPLASFPVRGCPRRLLMGPLVIHEAGGSGWEVIAVSGRKTLLHKARRL